jgi:23S rRNA (adenine2030-N6)-methyltransferase
MNYRHAYHAGNFADVLKHLVLALVVEHLKLKPAPFRVIDTHAGIASYDLSSVEAQKTGEWRDGIGRLLKASIPTDVETIFAPYLEAVRRENYGSRGTLVRYPGSPQIARTLLRAADKLVVNELHADDHVQLARHFAGDPQTKVLNLDGWHAVKALLPPVERRGVCLIDPPFEEAGEFERLGQALSDAHKRFAGVTAIAWFPVKDEAAVAAFLERAKYSGFEKRLAVVMRVRSAQEAPGLTATGLVISNPPFTLRDKLQATLPDLTGVLQQGPGAQFWIGALD